MRFLILFVTSVCLAGCVHDTNDFNLFVADSGASLYYIVGDGDAGEKGHDDPWTKILTPFSFESEPINPEKSHDDPWTNIFELSAKNVEDGHLSFRGRATSSMVFVSFDRMIFKTDDPSASSLTLVEVRENIARFESADGRSLFGIGVPVGWGPGLVLRGEVFLLDSQKAFPLVGAVVWDVDRTSKRELKSR